MTAPQYVGGPCCGRAVPASAINPHVISHPILPYAREFVTVHGHFEYALTGTGDYRCVGERDTVPQADGVA